MYKTHFVFMNEIFLKDKKNFKIIDSKKFQK